MAKKKIVRKPIEKLSEKERSAKQLANDQRLRDMAAARKAGKAKPEITLDTTLYKGEPIKETPQQDPDDKPLTMKEYKALLASQKTEEKPAEVKPKRKYTKRAKQEAPAPPTPTPTPSPTPPQKPNMMFV